MHPVLGISIDFLPVAIATEHYRFLGERTLFWPGDKYICFE